MESLYWSLLNGSHCGVESFYSGFFTLTPLSCVLHSPHEDRTVWLTIWTGFLKKSQSVCACACVLCVCVFVYNFLFKLFKEGIFFLVFYVFHLFTVLLMHTYMLWCAYGSQRTLWEWERAFIVRPGKNGLAANAFVHLTSPDFVFLLLGL